jgi:hypothetical protein
LVVKKYTHSTIRIDFIKLKKVIFTSFNKGKI